MRRLGLLLGATAMTMMGVALTACTGDDALLAEDAGADAPATATAAEGAPTPPRDAGLDASPDATTSDATTSDATTSDAATSDATTSDATTSDATTSDAGAPEIVVNGAAEPVLGFDFDDTTLVFRDRLGFHACPLAGCSAPAASYTTLALAPPARFTMSGGRLYWVSAASPATTFEIRSLDAVTLTGQRKENTLFCTSVTYLRAEATAAIAVYRASSSPTGTAPQTYTLSRTPNLSRTGVAPEGHCVATGCETATHRYALIAGSIVRTPK